MFVYIYVPCDKHVTLCDMHVTQYDKHVTQYDKHVTLCDMHVTLCCTAWLSLTEEVEIKYEDDKSVGHNVVYGTKPAIFHGNGPSKVCSLCCWIVMWFSCDSHVVLI